MKRVFIIHRWEGKPQGDWLPWIKSQLENLGYEVVIPHMPDTDVPVIKKWVNFIRQLVGEPNDQTYFIGHSIGCQAILRYLETIDQPVGGAMFIAGWFNLENLEDQDTKEIAKPWLTIPINIEKVKKVLDRSILIISDNDPFGAFEENKKKFSELGSEIVVLNGVGHITEEDGLTEIPLAVEWFRKTITDQHA